MRNGNHRGLGDIVMSDCGIFQIDRAYPFAAGLDDVFAAVGDLHVAVRVDRRDIACMEPTVLLDRGAARLGIIEIAADDPRAAHQQFAHRFAVMRLYTAGFVDDLHLDAENWPALLRLDRHLRLLPRRRCLAFSAAVVPTGLISVIPQACSISMPCRSNASIIDGGTADPPETTRRKVEQRAPVGREIGLEGEPHGRDAEADRHPLGFEQLVEARPVETRPGQDELRAVHRRGIGDAPAAGVKQRHHRADRVSAPTTGIASGSEAPYACSTVERWL